MKNKPASSKTPVAEATVRPPVKTTSTKKPVKPAKKPVKPKSFPPIVVRILGAIQGIVEKSNTVTVAAIVSKIPPPPAPPQMPPPAPSLNTIQSMVRGELDAHTNRNPTPSPSAFKRLRNLVVFGVVCPILVLVGLLVFRGNATKTTKAAMVAAESSEKISKEIINKVSKLATREDIKSEIKSDGDNTRKDINSATAALVDKATLSVGEINKHSSGLAKSIQEKVDATGSSLEQIKKTLDEQKPAPTTDEMRRTVGETLLAFKRLEQPATVPSNVPAANATENETSTTSVVSVTPVTVVSQSASVAVVPAMAITQGIVNEKLNREYLSPGTISRRYTAEMIRHGKVKITKRYGIVTVNNHLPGTWHRAEQISQIKILPTNGITTYSDADWVTFTSASPMEIELRR